MAVSFTTATTSGPTAPDAGRPNSETFGSSRTIVSKLARIVVNDHLQSGDVRRLSFVVEGIIAPDIQFDQCIEPRQQRDVAHAVPEKVEALQWVRERTDIAETIAVPTSKFVFNGKKPLLDINTLCKSRGEGGYDIINIPIFTMCKYVFKVQEYLKWKEEKSPHG